MLCWKITGITGEIAPMFPCLARNGAGDSAGAQHAGRPGGAAAVSEGRAGNHPGHPTGAGSGGRLRSAAAAAAAEPPVVESQPGMTQ